MKKDEFDEMLMIALNKKANSITPSPHMLQRVKNQVNTGMREENIYMKLFNAKKLIVIGAIFALSVTCYAAVKHNISVVASFTDNIASFEELDKENEKLGMDAKYVESFASGFAFYSGGTGITFDVDENGNAVGAKEDLLTLNYRNKEDKTVSLNIEKADPLYPEFEEGYSVTNSALTFASKQVDAGDGKKDFTVLEDAESINVDEVMITVNSQVPSGDGTMDLGDMEIEAYAWKDGDLLYTLSAVDMNLGESTFKTMADEIKAQ